MPFVFAPSTYDAPARPPTPSNHKRSASTESTTSTLSIISSSTTTSRSCSSLRERRGVTFQLSSSESFAEIKALALEPKSQLELHSENVPRRRALPMPINVFDPTSVMGEYGAKNSSARDFGMGEDGWTVVTL